MVLKILKECIRFQHTYLPIPLFVYKYLFKYKFFYKLFYRYYRFCFYNDFIHENNNNSKTNQLYWLSKRSLYWHYTHYFYNRFTPLVEEIYKEHKYLFDNKKVCDFMCGLSPFFKNKKIDLILIEVNKYCCKILKDTYPNSKIINENWTVIEKYQNEIDTLFLASGCLIYLDSKEIEKFFKITNNIKNFIIIHEGTPLDDFSTPGDSSTGHNQWNIESRLKKYNNHFSKSKIYFKKAGKIYDYFIFTS